MTITFVRGEPLPSMPAPNMDVGPLHWLRREVFSSPMQAIATVAGTYVAYLLISSFIDFAVIRAVWQGNDRAACSNLPYEVGACWPFIWAKLGQLTYGFYPADERWRVNIVFLVALVLLIPLSMPRAPYKLQNAIAFFGVLPIFAFIFLYGGSIITPWLNVASWMFATGSAIALALHLMRLNEQADLQPLRYGTIAIALVLGFALSRTLGMPRLVPAMELALLLGSGAAMLEALQHKRAPRMRWAAYGMLAAAIAWLFAAAASSGFFEQPSLRIVPTSQWGGLFVTLVVATTGIVASLPTGIVLALARRSNAAVLRVTAIAFIEVVRGVPLITVLFFATYMLPLFLEHSPDAMVRVLVGISLFSGAYMAETVRGGLQAIGTGQHEAAAALGLNYGQSTGLIVLPQALRLVIPGIVNSFIGLLKDTTLVSIVAIFDLLGGLRAAFADPNWTAPSTLYTGFAYAGMMYFALCFLISTYSKRLEERLRVDHRN
ncbi:amino acid ABC transporter permease (plasmid) [Bosea vestrisii]|uniref:amino acid ABC transporter permease n=1 Tax=Bosea vestrisii TaxID=151416 RepID=UPI0024DFE8BC|nr:amino acid ABC transporter permease [Bosea vestrisii]WID99821.1 amino acid ABC transporter permease [Bosea vestrisii]